jgi:hypothetical protein
MKIILGLPAILAVTLCSVQQPDDPEKLLKESLQAMQDVTAVLKAVKDKTTAKAAVTKLDAPSKQWIRVSLAIDKLEKSKAEQLYKLKEKQQNLFAYAFDLLAAELKRLDREPELFMICNKNEAFNEAFGQGVSVEGQCIKARIDLKILEHAAVAYRMKNKGIFPDNLAILIYEQDDGGPAYIQKSRLVDPWGLPYVYDVNQRHPETKLPLIYSKGPPGLNMPVRNWDY